MVAGIGEFNYGIAIQKLDTPEPLNSYQTNMQLYSLFWLEEQTSGLGGGLVSRARVILGQRGWTPFQMAGKDLH